MIIVVSDVHLGHERCNRESFCNFVDYLSGEDFDYLVFLGDIIDFWRRTAENVLSENRDILSELTHINAKKYYVLGNHDYTLPGIAAQNFGFTFRKTLTLESGHKTFKFIHGYQIEFRSVLWLYQGICRILCTSGDSTGKILNDVWDFYQHKIRNVTCRKDVSSDSRGLTKEELDDIVNYILMYPEEKPPEYREDFFSRQAVIEYKASANMDPEDILVYGHTHDPFVNEDEANPGCWVSGSYLENSYLVIQDGRIDLNYWDDEKTKVADIRHPGDVSSQAEMEAVV